MDLNIINFLILLLSGALIGATVQWWISVLDKKYIITTITKDKKSQMKEEVIGEINDEINRILFCFNLALLELYLNNACNSCAFYDVENDICTKHNKFFKEFYATDNALDTDICKDWKHSSLSKEECYPLISKLVEEVKEIGIEKFQQKYQIEE